MMNLLCAVQSAGRSLAPPQPVREVHESLEANKKPIWRQVTYSPIMWSGFCFSKQAFVYVLLGYFFGLPDHQPRHSVNCSWTHMLVDSNSIPDKLLPFRERGSQCSIRKTLGKPLTIALLRWVNYEPSKLNDFLWGQSAKQTRVRPSVPEHLEAPSW